jgi:hypothetical protein
MGKEEIPCGWTIVVILWACQVFQIVRRRLCGYHQNKWACNVEQIEWKEVAEVEDNGLHGRLASAIRRNHQSRVLAISGSDDMPYSRKSRLVSRGKERRKPVCTIYCNEHVGGADKKEIYLLSRLECYLVPQFSVVWLHRKTTWQKLDHPKLERVLVEGLLVKYSVLCRP